MMKKFLAVILCLAMLFSLAACGSAPETAEEPAAPTTVSKAAVNLPAVEAEPIAESPSVAEEVVSTPEPQQKKEYDVELREFSILMEEQLYTYQYRPGMSLSEWACSELNTDGWKPWFDDTVLSPDENYMSTSYHWSLDEFLGTEHEYLPVKENNRHNHYFASEYSPQARGSSEPMTIQLSGISGSDLANMSQEELKDLLAQNGVDVGGQEVTFKGPVENMYTDSAEDSDCPDLESIAKTEYALFGNISLPVAHMVNAKTPLFTPGFRIIGANDGRIYYHAVRLGYGYYLLDDVLDIYMNNISDEVLSHVKLYAFPESEAFLESLGDQTILNAHPTPLDKDSEMLKIPENAYCLSFQRVPDGQDAPGSLNHRTSEYPNENKDAVYARYVTKDDPNFGPGVNLVFAITYDDELVYWIHMGANFNESVPAAPTEMPY